VNNRNFRKPERRKQLGLTLTELMVSITISVFLSISVIGMYSFSSDNFTAIKNSSSIQEGLRAVYSLLRADILRSGNFGGIDRDEHISLLISGTASDLDESMLCPKIGKSSNFAQIVSQPLYGLNDNADGLKCLLKGKYLRGDFLILRYGQPVFEADILDDHLYMKTGISQGVMFQGIDKDEPENNIPMISSSYLQLVAHGYFVGDSGRTCNNKPVPSLFRVAINEKTNGTHLLQELLPGVENIQFQFLEDNGYKNSTEVVDWAQVKSIKMDILMRSECRETIPNPITSYDIGDIKYTVPSNEEDFRRTMIQEVVALRN